MLPVVPSCRYRLSASTLDRCRRLAEALRHDQPELAPDPGLDDLVPRGLREAGAIHVDDLSAIAAFDQALHKVFLEERAALRAADGDVVVTCTPAVPPLERFFAETLGLGRPTWLHATPDRSPLALCAAAWTDRAVRGHLVHALRHRGVRYLHPYMAHAGVWSLARLLRQASRRPIEVIGPPPALCRRVNDKTWFAAVVSRLLGAGAVPRSVRVWNHAGLATVVRHFATRCDDLVVKLPDSAGGVGNVRLPTAGFRHRPVGEIRAALRRYLPKALWQTPQAMLVSFWQADVLHSPSVQLWIPPLDDGLPMIEGVFEQLVEEPCGRFRGCRPARLARSVRDEIVENCARLGVLFQHLGYVGRCSFDLIVTGGPGANSPVEFIECNGRWGGTSLPMTLLNRLFGDWEARPFAIHECSMPGLARLGAAGILEALGEQLYDPATDRGWLIPLNASGVPECDRIDLMALGEDLEQASVRAERVAPELLRRLVAPR